MKFGSLQRVASQLMDTLCLEEGVRTLAVPPWKKALGFRVSGGPLGFE